jgi:hypothetical protein
MEGSYVPQVYVLGRVGSITRPAKQLVAFTRVYLAPGESTSVAMDLEVSRYLAILDKGYQWAVEPGEHTFALMENGGAGASTSGSVTLTCQ